MPLPPPPPEPKKRALPLPPPPPAPVENKNDYTGMFTGSHPFFALGGDNHQTNTPTPDEQKLIDAGTPGRAILSKYGRSHDDTIVTGVDGAFDNLNNRITNFVGTHDIVPSYMTPAVAGAASFIGAEIPRAITNMFNSGTGVATMGGFKKADPGSRLRNFLNTQEKAPNIKIYTPPSNGYNVTQYVPESSAGNTAKDTLLAKAIRLYDDPEKLESAVKPVKPESNFQRYAQADEEIRGDVARTEQKANEKFQRFITPSTTDDIPASPGSRRMGFEERPGVIPDKDGSIYTTIPERLFPRRVQSGMEALVPNRLKGQMFEPPDAPKLESWKPEPEVPQEPQKITRETRKLVNQEVNKDGVIVKKSQTPYAGGHHFIKTVADNSGLDANVLTTALKHPELKDIASGFIKEESVKKAQNGLAFVGTRLKALGENGVELYRRSARYNQEERQLLADWAENYKGAITKLTKTERQSFGEIAEGKRAPSNEREQAALDAWTKAQKTAGSMARDSGMTIKYADGTKGVFEPIEKNYWPRRMSEEDIANLPKSVDKLVKQGMSREQAETIIQNAREYGELMLPSQHERLGGAFKYRNDAESGLIHLERMAKQVARVRNFGPEDINGKGASGIADLINGTPDPGTANMLMKRVVGRDEIPDKKLDSLVRKARTVVSWARLQNYGVSAITGNQLPNALRSNTSEYVKSITDILTKYKAMKAISDEAGAMVGVSHGVLEEMSKLNPMKLYGGELAENVVRTQAAGIGRGMANVLFNEVKKNPLNKKAAEDLFELVLEHPGDLAKQDKLTEAQLKMAAGRGAELSQGLTNPLNMPYFASTPVTDLGSTLVQLGLIFKKQAIIQSKVIKDAFIKNPVKTTALFTAMGQGAGYAIGHTKSAIAGATRAAISGKPVGDKIKDEFEHRADYTKNILPDKFGGNKFVREAVDRQLQGWSMGIYADLLQMALGGRGAWLEGLAGPVIGGASELATNAVEAAKQAGKSFRKNSGAKALAREALRVLPVPGGVGNAAARELIPSGSN